jgi:hypothetical protein
LQHLFVALYVRYGELKKVQRTSRPTVKGNVSRAGEGAITATQQDCDAEVLQLELYVCLPPADTRSSNQTEHRPAYRGNT